MATKDPTHGKLGPYKEGPNKIVGCYRRGTYHLEMLDRQKLHHPWNAKHLRRYYHKCK